MPLNENRTILRAGHARHDDSLRIKIGLPLEAPHERLYRADSVLRGSVSGLVS
jgi:hypothetical protein